MPRVRLDRVAFRFATPVAGQELAKSPCTYPFGAPKSATETSRLQLKSQIPRATELQAER